MLNSGQKFRGLRDKKTHSNSCVVDNTNITKMVGKLSRVSSNDFIRFV